MNLASLTTPPSPSTLTPPRPRTLAPDHRLGLLRTPNIAISILTRGDIIQKKLSLFNFLQSIY